MGLLRADPDWQWDRARLDTLLTGEQEPIPEDRIIFATHDDKQVSTACITLKRAHGAIVPSFGWVVTHQRHRRRGLATAVCITALARIRGLGYAHAYLTTESYRTTAIEMYVKLGFELELIGCGRA